MTKLLSNLIKRPKYPKSDNYQNTKKKPKNFQNTPKSGAEDFAARAFA